MAKITPQMTISEALQADKRTLRVFTKHGLDACCGGNQVIAEAAAAKGVDLQKLVDELNATANS